MDGQHRPCSILVKLTIAYIKQMSWKLERLKWKLERLKWKLERLKCSLSHLQIGSGYYVNFGDD